MLGVPRGFFHNSLTRSHEIHLRVTRGAAWPSRVPAHENVPWANFQCGDDDELTLFDVERNGKPEFPESGLSTISQHLGRGEYSDGVVSFYAVQDVAPVVIALVRRLKMRALVITGGPSGVESWNNSFFRYVPDIKIVAGDKSGWQERRVAPHVVIAPLDFVEASDAAVIDRSDFGFVVFDCIGSEVYPRWSTLMFQFPAARRLAVVGGDADLSRGLGRMISYHLGQRVFAAVQTRVVPRIRRVWSKWSPLSDSRANPQLISVDTFLGAMRASAVYNGHVADQIALALAKNRKIVVFGDSVSHLRLLKSEIEQRTGRMGTVVDFVVDGMTLSDVNEASLADVILSTYRYAPSLPEMPDVDTVVLATPISNPIRVIGSVFRCGEGKNDPVVVDMRCDAIPACKDYASRRDRAYLDAYGDGA